MKKLLFILLSVPMLAWPASIGLSYNDWDDYSDGIAIEFDSTLGSNMVFDFDYHDVDADGTSINVHFMHLGYAFGDLSEGSFHLGVSNFDADYYDDGSGETGVTIGYTRRAGAGGDYSIKYSDLDAFEILEFDYVTDSGVSFGIMDDGDGTTVWTIGYTFQLGGS
tara:strand:+ start:145 stop:639 length:495 start_codon:yes stop_codon:yes gene_type:complete